MSVSNLGTFAAFRNVYKGTNSTRYPTWSVEIAMLEYDTDMIPITVKRDT